MNDSVEVRWQIEDGYAGHGSHSFEVTADEIREYETVGEAIIMIEDMAQQEFENKASWCFSNHDEFRSRVEEILANKAQSL